MSHDVPDLLNDPPPRAEPARAKQHKQQSGSAGGDRFFGCPIWWLDRVLPVVKSKGELVVAIYLYRLRVVHHSKTVDVSNGWLRDHGVGRYTKCRTLARLAGAGLIRVRQEGKGAPRVTFLK